jgi:TM2 domain-containing membrane protein YozV
MPYASDHLDRFQPVAALCAVLCPGAGQFFLGFRARGLAIAGGVLGLFFTGLFVGGVSCVDRKEDPVWFIGQALAGPVAFGVDALNQSRFKGYDDVERRSRYPDPGQGLVQGPGGGLVISAVGTPAVVRSQGRAAEMGVLFTALAGMLNLIVLIDAAFSCTREEHDDAEREAAIVAAANSTVPPPPAPPAAPPAAPIPGVQA